MTKSTPDTLTWTAGEDRIKVYCGADGSWFWRRTAKNNEVISDGGQGYDSISEAAQAARRANQDSGATVGPRRPKGEA